MSDVGDDVVAVPEVRGEHAVVSGEVGAWAWDQRGKPGNEVEGVEDDVSGPVTEGVLESVDDLSPFIDREAFVGECRAGDVAAQAFEGVALVGMAHGAGMEGASRELSDAGGGRRRAGRDGVQGKRLASGVRADGDAVVDGGAEELLESVGGFEVEGGGLVVTEQQSLLLEGAGDDGVEQALEFRLGRGGDTVEAGPFIFERVQMATIIARVESRFVQDMWVIEVSGMICGTVSPAGRLDLGERLPVFGRPPDHTQMKTADRYAHLAGDTVKAPGTRIGDSNEHNFQAAP